MNGWRTFAQSGIALFCEAVWLYYGLFFLVNIQWKLGFWPQALAWVLPAIVAYVVNYWLGGKNLTIIWLFLTNAVLLVGCIIPQWTFAYTGQLAYTLMLSFAIAYLYLRSSMFVYKEPTRMQMVLRFEGNIIFYTLVILIMFTQGAIPIHIHLFFFLSVLAGLLGMLLSLSGGEESNVETRTVGEAGFLPVLMIILLLIGVCLSLLLLLPSVRHGLWTMLTSMWSGITWLASIILKGFIWLFSLFPEPELKEQALPEAGPSLQLPEEISQLQGELPLLGILAVLAILAILIVLWISSYFLRNWKRTTPVRLRRTRIQRTPFWRLVWGFLLSVGRHLMQIWKRRFPSFFRLPIYWYFYQVTRWAKKQGLTRTAAETPQEFIRRLLKEAPISSELHAPLDKLGKSYSSAYYSGGQYVNMEDFSHLLVDLKKKEIGL